MTKSVIHNLTGTHCIVCDEDLILNPRIILHRTRRQTHSVCLSCFVGYVEPIVKVMTNNFRKNIKDTKIKCPGTIYQKKICRHEIDIFCIDVPKYLPIYIDIYRLHYIIENNNTYICPTSITECGNVVEARIKFRHNNGLRNVYETNLTCNSCNINWCCVCNVSPYHSNLSCLQYQNIEKNTENGKYLSELESKGELKYCPCCKSPTTRTDGCNKMICETCGMKYCWLCLEMNIDYSHFNSYGDNACANRLWEGASMDVDVDVEHLENIEEFF
jgi:hypothetical protein